MSSERASAGEPVTYAYRPSLLGAAREFKLAGDGIDWAAGRKSGHIPFRTVRRLRMSYRPASMQSHRFMTELWADGAPKLEILSSSWKSMVEQERLDKPYAAFVAELHRRIALAAPPARFEQGSNPLLYWPGLIDLCRRGARAGLAGRARLAGRRQRRRGLHRRLSRAVSLAGRQFLSPQPAWPLSAEALPAELMPKG